MPPAPQRVIATVVCVGAVLAASAALSGPAAAQSAEQTAPTPAATGVLVLSFEGLKSDKGSILAAVYASEAAYGGGAPIRAVKAEIANGTASVEIPGLAPGSYAVKSFHDLKGDGKLTFNMFGLPTEPVAFSNNAKIKGKAPSWSETAFAVGAGRTTQSITID
jgi:uncharacterized protein (DUF2141 family)